MTEVRSEEELEAMARELEATERFRVLRRLEPRRSKSADVGRETRLGLFLDLETTGLDPAHDEVIELAMTPFRFSPAGEILEVLPPFEALQAPSRPIPPEVTALTGIDDAMVAGQTIDANAVCQFAAPAVVILAHNAAFDRPFAERLCDVFTTKAWGCSMSQIDWAVEGFEGTKLAYLVARAGFFYDGHRAVHDCAAAIELLSRPLPKTGEIALSRLLVTARRPTWRIWAENAPYDLKDVLKRRGYRWSGGEDGRPRAWYFDALEETRDAELAFLRSEIYRGEIEPLTRRITAFDRFSDRC